MPEESSPASGMLAPAQVAEQLGIGIDEVVDLVQQGQLRGLRVGSPARLRIDRSSVSEYLDSLAEIERRASLWRQSSEASFPELWGTGHVRHSD